AQTREGDDQVAQSARHADDDGKDDKGGVARVLDDGAKANDGESADQREGAPQPVADDLRHHGDDDAQEDERGYKARSNGGFPSMSQAIDAADDAAQDHGQGQPLEQILD